MSTHDTTLRALCADSALRRQFGDYYYRLPIDNRAAVVADVELMAREGSDGDGLSYSAASAELCRNIGGRDQLGVYSDVLLERFTALREMDGTDEEFHAAFEEACDLAESECPIHAEGCKGWALNCGRPEPCEHADGAA